jgi:hypothetical protein
MANDDATDSVQIEGFIGESDDHLVIGVASAREVRRRLSLPQDNT